MLSKKNVTSCLINNANYIRQHHRHNNDPQMPTVDETVINGMG